MDVTFLPQLNGDVLVTTKLSFRTEDGRILEFMVQSIYIPYDCREPPPVPEVKELVHKMKEIKVGLLFDGDGNFYM